MKFVLLISSLILVLNPLEVHAETGGNLNELMRTQLSTVRAQPASVGRDVEESRLLFYQARLTDDMELKRKFLGKGIKLAERARAAAPQNPGAILWWAGLEGQLAAINKDFAALAKIKVIETELKRLEEIAPDFEHAAAYRALGGMYESLPPIISIGSTRKAQGSFKQAMRIDPNYPGNQIAYAGFTLSLGNCSEAKRLARQAMESVDFGKYPFENGDWKKMAARIMEHAEGSRCH